MGKLDAKTEYAYKVWLEDRRRCRHDLMFLSKDILHYNDIEEDPHRRLMDCLQQFPEGNITEVVDTSGFPPRKIEYTWRQSLWQLTGPRFRLILWPRGHLKTTTLTIAHTIQWILNFPDIRILISTAVADQAHKILAEMKAHFQHNPHLYFLFPEYCPVREKVAEFGTQESFTVPNRQRKWLKEPTVSVSSLGKVLASYHYEILKFSDMVDKENVKTPNQIREVIEHIKYCDPLLERNPIPPHHGWKDIEGTRYGVADAYGDIIRREAKAKTKLWQISVESADPKDRANGKVLWPTRYPLSELQRIEREDEFQYNSQYRQKPIPESSSLTRADQIVFFPRVAIAEIALRVHTTVDLHGMENNRGNDFTVLTTGGFDRDGRLYITDIRRARFTPFEVITHLFDIHVRYRPIDIKIEKDAHARVLLPFLQRESAKRGIFPVFVPLRRDNQTTKQQRIRGLQSWFQTGIIRFADDLSCKADLLEEILNFPDPSIHDDILDTLADMMTNRDGELEYDVYPNAPREGLPLLHPAMMRNRFLGFDETGQARWLMDPETEMTLYDKAGI